MTAGVYQETAEYIEPEILETVSAMGFPQTSFETWKNTARTLSKSLPKNMGVDARKAVSFFYFGLFQKNLTQKGFQYLLDRLTEGVNELRTEIYSNIYKDRLEELIGSEVAATLIKYAKKFDMYQERAAETIIEGPGLVRFVDAVTGKVVGGELALWLRSDIAPARPQRVPARFSIAAFVFGDGMGG